MLYLEDLKGDWKNALNQVICADSLEVMKLIPDGAIDLTLSDPPYGINIASKGQVGGVAKHDKKWRKPTNTKFEPKEWDKFIPSKEYFDQMFRISKNQIIFGGNYFVEYLTNSPCWIFWDKKNGGSTFADGELAWTSFKTSVRKFAWKWSGMFHEKGCKEKREHPTQKPLELMRWCLENYAKDCKTVIDPFAGAFTTARACKDMGFDWIAIDKEEKYCTIGEKRLEQECLF